MVSRGPGACPHTTIPANPGLAPWASPWKVGEGEQIGQKLEPILQLENLRLEGFPNQAQRSKDLSRSRTQEGQGEALCWGLGHHVVVHLKPSHLCWARCAAVLSEPTLKCKGSGEKRTVTGEDSSKTPPWSCVQTRSGLWQLPCTCSQLPDLVHL